MSIPIGSFNMTIKQICYSNAKSVLTNSTFASTLPKFTTSSIFNNFLHLIFKTFNYDYVSNNGNYGRSKRLVLTVLEYKLKQN